VTYQIAYADETDLPHVRSMAIELMPAMTALHTEGWNHRLGQGRAWAESLLLVVRDTSASDDQPVGFCWTDPAMLADNGIREPWWCVNAIAIRPAHRRRGLATQILSAVKGAAASAGVVTLHGVCDRELSAWYEDQGFTVLQPGQFLESDGPVRMTGKPASVVRFNDVEGECMVFTDVDPTPPRRLRASARTAGAPTDTLPSTS